MAYYELNDSELRQALTQIPIPAATRNQSIWYLAHIGKIFYCLLEETMKNQPDDTPAANWEQMSEAFHKSLFDLEILTTAFLEGQYVPAARVVVMTRNASTPRGNDILRFALAEIHLLYSHIEKKSCHDTVQWLFNEHGPYLRAEGFELSHLQHFFDLGFPEKTQA